jgi:hypothetical protein
VTDAKGAAQSAVGWAMSQLGQKRHFYRAPVTSGLPYEQTSAGTDRLKGASSGHTGPCCCMYADGGILLSQKRLCIDLVHEDEWNSMRCFAFYKHSKCVSVRVRASFRCIAVMGTGRCRKALSLGGAGCRGKKAATADSA